MYKDKKFLAVVTARGGSKGIPRKNIKDLCGNPLLAYTLEAAAGSRYLTSTIVSTDDQEIADIAQSCGGDVPFLRPAELAGDTSTSLPVIQHALVWLKNNRGEEFDYVMILQPTSPFRTAQDIDACIEKIVDTNADSVMSMVEVQDFSPKKLKKIENDCIVSLFEDEGKVSAFRDAHEKVYKRNCAIYLTKVEYIMQSDLFGKVSRPYVMPPERSLDINVPIDFEMAEFFMKKNKNT